MNVFTDLQKSQAGCQSRIVNENENRKDIFMEHDFFMLCYTSKNGHFIFFRMICFDAVKVLKTAFC